MPAARLFRLLRNPLVATALAAAVLGAVAGSWRWPYVMYGVGTAEPVHDRIETGKPLEEKGAFLFTTVTTYPRPDTFSLLYGWLHPRMEVRGQREATGGTVNYEAYRNWDLWLRENAEAEALIAAYSAAGIPVQVEQTGIIIHHFLEMSRARGNGLQEGDIITAVDGRPTRSAEELAEILRDKSPGDIARVSGTRGGRPFEAEVPLVRLSDGRTGIGFLYRPVIKVTPPDPVEMNFSHMGGPSAGLMMTLELVAHLTGEDLTRGYRIAGSGTISADGSVGPVGWLRYKLMAAHREKADYFLVPYVEAEGYGNWKEAEAAAREFNLSPRLVPVSSLQEAIGFLRSLPPKTESAGE
ncbi:MAG: hypothetical protein BAA02_14660 [Paenibacillaceae bacterium ZCTH02-B3]|nr:MAG: hypothetical protein BAA02_14660 [Paenibacillaceae bacterium ZCTH02-B3]